MSIDPLTLRPQSAFRPVDWRWEKAKLTREDARIAALMRHEDDDWIRKARKFQVQYSEARSSYDFLLLERRWPALLEALQLHNCSSPQLTKYEVQARLLANEPLEAIQLRVSVSVDALMWYERVFFNVLDRLPNRGYIAHRVLGESLQAGLTERDYQLLWQMYGYMAGPVVLDAMIDRHYDVTQPESPAQMTQFGTDDVGRTMLLKSMVASRTMPINSYTQTIILEIHQRFIELKKMADSGVTGDMSSGNILAMMNTLPWTIGDKVVLVASDDPKRIVGRLSSEIVTADSGAAELRSRELLQLAAGQNVAADGDMPPRLTKFPEETKNAVNAGSEPRGGAKDHVRPG